MVIHTVQSGDNLWSISQRYGVPLNQIIAANQIVNPNVLVIGQALVIPTGYRNYIVQPGDSLWVIANRFGLTIIQIARANNLSAPYIIYPGQSLTIPIRYHQVQQGENLWSIANRYGVTVQQIAEVNNITNPTLIYQGQLLTIPEREKPVIDVNAYITLMGESGSQIVDNLGEYFTYLSPFSHSVKTDGTISDLNDQLVIQAAQRNRVTPLLILTNFSGGEFSSDLAHTILVSPELQEKLITNILNTMRRKGYKGVNVDFEYLYPEDRENYNQFLRRLVNRMHPEGYSVSTALAPKVSADQKGLLYEAHDYEAHGEIVDFVILMTYEWGWIGGRPWAVAPINEVRRILDYAVTAIPRNKIVMGMPLYGYDWKIPFVEGTFAQVLSPKQAVDRAIQYQVPIQYHETYQSPFYEYVDRSGQQHVVWFEDARSVLVKYNTVKEYGLRGVSFWVLGNPFPQNWLVLEDQFGIRKL